MNNIWNMDMFFQRNDSGRTRGRRCVFPFTTRDGVTHQACTVKLADDGIPWCSTQTDDDGSHIIGTWGHCSQGCPEERPDDLTYDGLATFPFWRQHVKFDLSKEFISIEATMTSNDLLMV
jgi:hypothetical protein